MYKSIRGQTSRFRTQALLYPSKTYLPLEPDTRHYVSGSEKTRVLGLLTLGWRRWSRP